MKDTLTKRQKQTLTAKMKMKLVGMQENFPTGKYLRPTIIDQFQKTMRVFSKVSSTIFFSGQLMNETH